jgi:large repetitive protein
MDLSVLRRRTTSALGGLFALTVCVGSMQASSYLSASASSTTALTAPGVTCATLTGPPALPQSFTVHAFGAPAGFSIVVAATQIGGLQVTAPSPNILTAATNVAGLVFKVNSAPGCGNASGIVANTLIAGANTITLPLTAALNGGAAVADNGVAVTDTITTGAGTSALVAAPVTVTCGYNATGPVYVPGTPKNVAVTSAANLGTPFTVTTGSLPAWLQLGPAAPAGTAGTTAVNFTVQAKAGCGGFSTTQTYALPLASGPAPAVTVLITLNFTTISPLTVTPVPAAPSLSMSYTKGSGVAATQTVNLTSSISTPTASTFYQTTNFPIWLTVSYATGFIPYNAGINLIFSTTIAADSLAPGTYTATVFAQVANYADQPITITLLVANKAPTLSVTSANPMPVLYTLGGATPVSTITVVSTDSPIPYTISFGGLLAPQLTANEQLTGIAFGFGTNIGITYNPVLFETSAPGTVISGTVTFTWGPPATSTTPATVTVVTINLTVGSPAAILTSISPASLPTAAPGSVFSVTLTGSGFVGGTDPTLATKVGLVTGSNPATVNQDSNFHLTWINPSNMTLQITVPALSNGGNGDTSLPFLTGGGGGPVYLGVVNGSGTAPTGTAILTIGANPIIYGVTSSSSFTEVSGGALQSLAPYDMFSVFGASFCSSVDTFPAVGAVPAYSNGGCGTTTILTGRPDPVYNVFPFSLTPDSQILPTAPASALWRNLSVTLYPHGTLTGGLPAPLLFATNGQINAIVPGAAVAAAEYDIVVNFGPSGALASSAPFPVNIVATDPGIFTIGSDGQGPAAALQNQTYALLNSANPAAMRSGSGNSDTIQLFVTGLGAPPSPASSTCAPALTGAGNYLTALNTSTTPNGTFTTIDGAVIEDNLLGVDLPPCLYALTHGTQPTATVGGQPATVSYAAFVGDTVAGLYQMNIQLPSTTPPGDLQPDFPLSLTGEVPTLLIPMQLPIYVTVGGHTSQAGVVLSVAPQLKMVSTMPSSATVGVAYTGTITATLGTSTYTFAVTSGVLPAGLTLSQSTNVLTIAGMPLGNTSGTYNFTITATDSAAAPVTGSVTVTITVAGGLYVTSSAAGPFTGSVFGSAGTGLPTITAIGGTGPYAYAVTTSTLGSAPTGMSAPGAVTGVFATTAATPAGTYLVTVTATDSLGVTGSVNFTDTIQLLMNYAVTTAIPPAAGTTPIGTFTTTGNNVIPVHYTSSNPAFTIVDSTGVVSVTGLSDGAATATITATDTGTPPGAVAASHATQTFVINIVVTG